MDTAVPEVSASAEGVIWSLDNVDVADFVEHTPHLLWGHKTLVVERYQDKLGIDMVNEISEAYWGTGTDVVVRPTPVYWNTRDLADAMGPLVMDQEIEHKIV